MALPKNLVNELLKIDGGIYSSESSHAAFSVCAKIASQHYENFPVASLLVGKRRKKFFDAVYAFARLSDDIADEDELLSLEKRLEYLDFMKSLVVNTENFPTHPIALGLKATQDALSLPIQPFLQLLQAFRQDCTFEYFASWTGVHDYCRLSANPVGEIFLRIFDEYSLETHALSDKICTALQLVNFWQDISVDATKGRIYIPESIVTTNQLSLVEIYSAINSKIDVHKIHHFDSVIKDVVEHTGQLFYEGESILKCISSQRLKTELRLILSGGLTILKKISEYKSKVFYHRPVLSIMDSPQLVNSFLRLHF